ncbi:hypothetical protein GGR52DRAFT_512851 [Hypoxylon sp. FL1284]|nr:hypothetical protein GGR52DRAFT_512851 [Hypoxylon sp. FL1284]
MAIVEATQALLGAFFFGILFNGASAALLLYVIGQGSAIFRDGLRLVLILFLASSAAWALVEFLSTIIEPTAASTCQVAVVFSSVFDQLGRVLVEQYLVWAVRTPGNKALSAISQVLVLGRFGVGIAFVALTKNEFNPTCVPVSDVSAIGIVAIITDAIILAMLAARALSTGSIQDIPRKNVVLVAAGLGVWTGMSVVLLLGISATALVLRTTLPALGLAILVSLVTVLSGSLVAPRGLPPRRPDSPTSRDIGRVAGPSSSDPRDYAPSRYADIKEMNTTVMSAFVNGDGNAALPTNAMAFGGSRKKVAKGNAWAKSSGGKLAISNPVLKEEAGMGNPLDRIPTIDLATAANMEKERRDQALIAQRRAPEPPASRMLAGGASSKKRDTTPPHSEMNRSISTKTTNTTGGLSVAVNASSTSSELSPGTERIRRRSPRQPAVPPIPATFQPVIPGEPVRIPIPRPQSPPRSPKTPQTVKTPLQRRPTTGLPSNPRSQAVKSMVKETKSQRQETVMFINNIVYDDPTAVDDIVHGASKTPRTSLDSARSIVHRPRPIPRQGEDDRQVFPAESSPHGHKRSKSGGSIGSRKSILQSIPSSPSQLPPLPPPPKSAGNVPRPAPNDTKNMTFDEKMYIMYPPTSGSTPSTGNSLSRRRSIVPDIPPLPEMYAEITKSSALERPSDPEAKDGQRASKMTDRTSVRTTSILGIEDMSHHTQGKIRNPDAGNELGQVSSAGITAGNERKQGEPRNKTNRHLSPVEPVESRFSVSTTKTRRKTRDDDASTIWGSVHSPVAAVDIQKLRCNARSTYIEKDSNGSEEYLEQDLPPDVPEVPKIPCEVTTVMLAAEDQEQLRNQKATVEIPTFHYRVGEECPTFSTRRDISRLRKMPPPAPLILNGGNGRRALLVQVAEPSPLESPEAAYEMIQAQLQRLEQPNQESEQSPSQRLALLDNLEREMGQLENQWQTRLGHDSMSSIQTSPSKDSRPPSIAERRASRRISVRNSALQSIGEDYAGVLSSQSSGPSSENTRASVWQARLAEAQAKFLEDTPDLLMKRNRLSFLSVSKAALGSPSPPDTDESGSEGEVPAILQLLSPRVYQPPVVQVHELWKPPSPVQHPVGFGLWTGVSKKSFGTKEADDLPSLSVRPATRKTLEPLEIASQRLWQKPAEMSNVDAANGLWKKSFPSSPTRPTIMRPPRRTKRMTLLPDILENPEPLPDKKGALAIFQFPWGQKSEHATIQNQPRRPFTAMPGTMTAGGPLLSASLQARSRQLEADEFMTSFFDDYEAEEEGDNFDDFSDSDNEGDDFDENTIWEIANLLKTDSLPPKGSLLPQPLQSPKKSLSPQPLPPTDSVSPINNAPDLTDGGCPDGDIVPEEPIPMDRSAPASKPSVAQPLLWTAQPAFLEAHYAFGLPQPDSSAWESYDVEPQNITRSKTRTEEPARINSNELWSSESKPAELAGTGLLWSASKPAHSTPIVSSRKDTVVAAKSASLWTRPSPTLDSNVSGLFDIGHSRADYRRTSKEPAAFVTVRKPRAVAVQLEKLASRSLWTGESATQGPLLWERPVVMNDHERDSGLFNSNVRRSDYRRTTNEPAAISMQTALRTTQEPLPVLQTSSLWAKDVLPTPSPAHEARLFTPKQSVAVSHSATRNATLSAQVIPLWEKPIVAIEPQHEGLFDISVPRKDYRRTSETPAAIFSSSKPRSSKEPLPVLASNSLWTGEVLERELPAVAESSPVAEGPVESFVANTMWEKPTLVAPTSEVEGLFNANSTRVDYRRSSKLPAALEMTRKPRKTEISPASLTSTQLWELQTERTQIPASKTLLWNKPTMSRAITAGLFQLDSSRKVYRTTSAEPAALQMSRKPRLAKEPLPVIQSYNLWTRSQVTSVELDWITISSVPPRSPSVSSESAKNSAPSSPSTESSSVKTSTTKASSAKTTGGFFKGWFGKKKEPAADDIPKVPAVPEIPEELMIKNLDEIVPKPAPILAVEESRVSKMSALRASYPQDWEAALEEAIKASHVAPKIIRKPASPRDWSMALHQATLASYPEIRFSRGPFRAVPGQWEAAQQELMAESQLPQVTYLDAAIRHPVFMGSMETMAETIHPAIGPKVLRPRGNSKPQPKILKSQPARFDVTVRHPVFFGSMKMTAKLVHPAVERKDSKQSHANSAVSVSTLWAKTVSTRPVAAEGGMWPSNGSVFNNQVAYMNADVDLVRNSKRQTARASEIEAKPDFGKQGMWNQAGIFKPKSQDRDWLDDSMKKRFTRVELRY